MNVIINLGDISFKLGSVLSISQLDIVLSLMETIGKRISFLCSYLLYGDMKRLDVETEIKIKITEKDYKYLNTKMKSLGEFLKEVKQIDTYYNPRHRSFIENDEINEWLRIGERGGKTILNYKNWYQNAYCDEYEVELDNKENMDKILNILGLERIAVVDKVRTTYMYQDKYEVALDKVESLGYFIEIEVKKYEEPNNPLKEYDKLLKVATSLNLDLKNIDKRGYPYYLIEKNKGNI